MIETTGIALVAVNREKFTYRPQLSETERRAYAAAHRILSHAPEYGEVGLVCPGAVRSRRVDQIARLIAAEWNEEITC